MENEWQFTIEELEQYEAECLRRAGHNGMTAEEKRDVDQKWRDEYPQAVREPVEEPNAGCWFGPR